MADRARTGQRGGTPPEGRERLQHLHFGFSDRKHEQPPPPDGPPQPGEPRSRRPGRTAAPGEPPRRRRSPSPQPRPCLPLKPGPPSRRQPRAPLPLREPRTRHPRRRLTRTSPLRSAMAAVCRPFAGARPAAHSPRWGWREQAGSYGSFSFI